MHFMISFQSLVCFNKHLQISFGKIVDEVVRNTRHASSSKAVLELSHPESLLSAFGPVSWLTVA